MVTRNRVNHSTNEATKMKLILTNNTAEQKLAEKADAVITVPFEKGADLPRLPRFVQATLPTQKEKEGAKLSEAQIRRALRWYEALCRIESLIAATETKNFVIENGEMIGSFLLGQTARILPNVNVKYYDFEAEAWPHLKAVEAEGNTITVHVFAKKVSVEFEDKPVDIMVFAEKTKIVLPNFVVNAVDPKHDMKPVDRRKALTMYKYFVFMQVLHELGARMAVLQKCENMDHSLVTAIAKSFKKHELTGFPEGFFPSVQPVQRQAVSVEKLAELKQKFAA